jgi:hypothetical protein
MPEQKPCVGVTEISTAATRLPPNAVGGTRVAEGGTPMPKAATAHDEYWLKSQLLLQINRYFR